MKNLISCEMIEGKPKFTITPKTPDSIKKGDVVIGECCQDNNTSYYMWIKGNYNELSQCWVDLGDPSLTLQQNSGMCTGRWTTRKASFLEEQAMMSILSREGLKLVGKQVIPIRWAPRLGELYYFVKSNMYETGLFYCSDVTKRGEVSETLVNCFKTKEACQEIVDALNSILAHSKP